METAQTKRSAIRIGFISACIGDDSRYTDTLRVTYDPIDCTVTFTVSETGAAGGMDGPGGTTARDVVFTATSQPNPKAKDVLALVKRVIDNGRFSFKRYGKPTKRFEWYTEEGTQFGVNVALCASALAWAQEISKE